MNKTKYQQKGLYTVEFAIVASLFFLLFFACIEVARLMFTWNVLTEISRRGARLASVCPVIWSASDSTDIGVLASLSNGTGSFLPNFTKENIKIDYLTFENGAVTAASNFSEIRLVRASIDNYQHELLIPGYFITLYSPNFATTIPRESLGATRVDPTDCSQL